MTTGYDWLISATPPWPTISLYIVGLLWRLLRRDRPGVVERIGWYTNA